MLGVNRILSKAKHSCSETFKERKVMLVELSILPLAGDDHFQPVRLPKRSVVADDGLPYQLTPTATCIEGDWKLRPDLESSV